MAADYEREEFYLMQSKWPDPSAKADLVKVSRSGSESGGLSTGAIVGIAVGAAAVAAFAGIAIWWFCRRKRSNIRRRNSGSYRASSIGGTTMDGNQDGMLSQEYFKPEGANSELPEDQFKPELDATTTARGWVRQHRAELSGSVRRTSQQSGFSRNSAVSPMGDLGRRPNHLMDHSPASFGQPSPPQLSSRGSGQYSPGHPSPPMSESQYWGMSGPYELPAIPRGQTSSAPPPITSEPIRSEPVTAPDLGDGTADRSNARPWFHETFEDTAYNEQLRSNIRGPLMEERS
jgi:hypothetical protein